MQAAHILASDQVLKDLQAEIDMTYRICTPSQLECQAAVSAARRAALEEQALSYRLRHINTELTSRFQILESDYLHTLCIDEQAGSIIAEMVNSSDKLVDTQLWKDRHEVTSRRLESVTGQLAFVSATLLQVQLHFQHISGLPAGVVPQAVQIGGASEAGQGRAHLIAPQLATRMYAPPTPPVLVPLQALLPRVLQATVQPTTPDLSVPAPLVHGNVVLSHSIVVDDDWSDDEHEAAETEEGVDMAGAAAAAAVTLTAAAAAALQTVAAATAGGAALQTVAAAAAAGAALQTVAAAAEAAAATATAPAAVAMSLDQESTGAASSCPDHTATPTSSSGPGKSARRWLKRAAGLPVCFLGRLVRLIKPGAAKLPLDPGLP